MDLEITDTDGMTIRVTSDESYEERHPTCYVKTYRPETQTTEGEGEEKESYLEIELNLDGAEALAFTAVHIR